VLEIEINMFVIATDDMIYIIYRPDIII